MIRDGGLQLHRQLSVGGYLSRAAWFSVQLLSLPLVNWLVRAAGVGLNLVEESCHQHLRGCCQRGSWHPRAGWPRSHGVPVQHQEYHLLRRHQ